ncbi:hypothetical protein F4703DRAFT_1745196 [Phycomyces blakesleeanus]
MSFDIEWSKLDEELAVHVQQFLNRHFKSINKPAFIGDIEVTSFGWGTETPLVEIINITDPFPEFYEEDHDETLKDTMLHNHPPGLQSPQSDATIYYPPESDTGSITRPHLTLNPLSQQQRFNLMHSFHRSPLTGPQHPFSNPVNRMLSSPQLGRGFSGQSSVSAPFSGSDQEEDWIDDEQPTFQSYSRPPSEAPTNTTTNKYAHEANPTEMDFQAHVRIAYKGDMSMTVLTELRMNYPSMLFMSLPMQLHIKSIAFEATAVVAYIKSMDRVCVSMLEPELDGVPLRNKNGGLDR